VRNILWSGVWLGAVTLACLASALYNEIVPSNVAVKAMLIAGAIELVMLLVACYHSGTVGADLAACDAYFCGRAAAAAKEEGDDEEPPPEETPLVAGN